MTSLTEIKGIGPALAKRLEAAGIADCDALSAADPVALASIPGVTEARMATWKKAIAEIGGKSSSVVAPTGSTLATEDTPVASLEATGGQGEERDVKGDDAGSASKTPKKSKDKAKAKKKKDKSDASAKSPDKKKKKASKDSKAKKSKKKKKAKTKAKKKAKAA